MFSILLLISYPALASSKLCSCGEVNDISPGRNSYERIVGGGDFRPHKYPWLAMLQLNGSFLCGGSIISEEFVLSAAHCLIEGLEDSIKVVVGEHNRCKSDSKTVTFSVSKFIRHAKYDEEDFAADIMLLKLAMKINFNKFVRPICLPTYDIRMDVVDRYLGKRATVVGWGKRDPKASHPACIPKELSVPILPKKFCGQEASHSLFCAGFIEGGKDSCQGDSGGPLQILNRRNKFELIGIVSNGIGCALAFNPGLYTDVIKYLPWIWKHVGNSLYCW